jgi:hypothetical protein
MVLGRGFDQENHLVMPGGMKERRIKNKDIDDQDKG